MTWSKSVTLWCDSDNCPKWVRPGDKTVSAARDSSDSWVHHNGNDYCPDCAEERGLR